MKITQETNKFKPITIVLETREEARQVWESISNPYSNPLLDEIEEFLLRKLNES